MKVESEKLMEWTQDLLDIINDPMFDGVRLKPQPVTADDRVKQKLMELQAWIDANGREPQPVGDIKEKMMNRRMITLKEQGLWN